MLFGKLGGNPPEFRCRPYQDVLKEIAVTHSPRYLIDMELSQSETIFAKMGISYDEFRKDENKIEFVREYYRKKAQKEHKSVVPWWLGTDTPVAMNVMRKGLMSPKDRLRLTSEMLILFPEVISSDYDAAAVWLCTRRNTINPSFRDLFSAGGTCIEVDGKKLNTRYPHIVGTLLECNTEIEHILNNNYQYLIEDIKSVWPHSPIRENLYNQWISLVEAIFKSNIKLKDINIVSLMVNKSLVTKYQG